MIGVSVEVTLIFILAVFNIALFALKFPRTHRPYSIVKWGKKKFHNVGVKQTTPLKTIEKKKSFKWIGAAEAFIEALFVTYLFQPKSSNKVCSFVWKFMLILDRTKSFKQMYINIYAALEVLSINMSKLASALVMHVSAYPYQ